MVTLPFFRGNFLSAKRPKMPKGQTKFIKVNQLEMRPNKGQKANYNFLGQTTWSLKKEANLVTLMTGPFSHEVHSGVVLPQIFCAPPSFVVPRKSCFKQIPKTKKIGPLNLAPRMILRNLARSRSACAHF